jgi:hypothetical protein
MEYLIYIGLWLFITGSVIFWAVINAPMVDDDYNIIEESKMGKTKKQLEQIVLKKSKAPELFEGRTKEWDTQKWQGRSEYQVEANYKVMGFTFMVVVASLVLYGLFNLVTYVLG